MSIATAREREARADFAYSIVAAGGNGNPSPAPAAPQEIKIVNSDAVSPALRSTEFSDPSASRPDEQASPAQSSQREAQSPISLAEQVNRFSLTNRDHAINDLQTDIFDFQGPSNREETLNAGEAVHAAQAQLEGRSTAVDVRPSAEGAALNRFRQQDVELGRVRAPRSD